jgi:hypothetical protein
MPLTRHLTKENVNLDDDEEVEAFDARIIAAGMARVLAEGEELRRRGLLDSEGRVLLKELPADMREGSERDFGG